MLIACPFNSVSLEHSDAGLEVLQSRCHDERFNVPRESGGLKRVHSRALPVTVIILMQIVAPKVK